MELLSVSANRCELIFVVFRNDGYWHNLEECHDLVAEIQESLSISPSPWEQIQFVRNGEIRELHRGHDGNGIRVVEISEVGHGAPAQMHECTHFCAQNPSIQRVQRDFNVQIVLQPAELYQAHKQPGLAVFDMDSTLIQQEVIDELARAVGCYDQVAAITDAAMRGEAPYTDFEASLRARVALLNGVPTSIWDDLKATTITFTPGAVELVRALKARGWKTAVLSGGFTPLADWVKATLGLDYAYANHLVEDRSRGVLTGELEPGKPIVHGERKRALLLQLAAENGIPVARTVAVGDGSNDLPMMHAAGLGIAFNAKPRVQAAAPARLNGATLRDVMFVLGLTTSDKVGRS